jgi:hypothetical protein
MRFLLIIGIILILLPETSFAVAEFSVGVSPSIVDLGMLSRGSTNIVKFFLVTPSTEPLLVYLNPERGNIDFFATHNGNLITNFSEEDTSTWVNLLKNPVELTPSNQTLQTVAGQISGWREVNFLVDVPNNAEPGYHIAKVKPAPSVPSEIVAGAGARVVAVTYVTVLFDVPGDSERQGVILDVNSGGFIGNELEIRTYFQNTGTDTISARAYQSIYKNVTGVSNISSSIEFVKPGETKVLMSYLPMTGISLDSYDVKTTVSYTTGIASRNSTISISNKPAAIAQQPEAFPLWILIFVFIIILIAVLIYRWSK